MKLFKRLSIFVLSLVAVVVCTLGIAACGDDKETNKPPINNGGEVNSGKEQCTSHTYGDWQITLEATCTTDGTKKHVCTKCKHEETEKITATGHDWNAGVVTTAATCTTKGVKTFTCTHDSSHTKTEEVAIDANAHNYKIDSNVAATCTQDGLRVQICSICNDRKEQTLEHPGHTVEEWLNKDITSHEGTCAVCHNNITVLHEWKDNACKICSFNVPGTQGLGFILSEDETYYICTDATNCKDKNIIIPSYYNGLPVYEVDDRDNTIFSYAESVVVSDGIKIIRSGYRECSNLKSVTIGKDVEEIYNGFNSCYNLKEIYFNAINCKGISIYENYLGIQVDSCVLFSYAGASTDGATIYIGSDVQVINDKVFACIAQSHYDNEKGCYYYPGLKSVVFEADSKCKSIGNEAFQDQTALTNINIPDCVTSIGDSAFKACKNLEEINIPSGINEFGKDVFAACNSLKYSEIDGANYLGNKEIPNLMLFELKDKTLSNFEVKAGTKIIYNSALLDCTALTKVKIPESVIQIGEYIFNGCSKLVEITVAADNKNYKSVSGNLYTKDGSVLIQYGVNKTNSTFVLPDGVVEIADGAFRFATNLTNINLNYGLKTIGNSAFLGCTELAKINIPDSVSFIGEKAFSDCCKLESINLPEGLTSIAEYTFNDCRALKSITIPESVTSIGMQAFSYCSTLTHIKIPKNVEEIWIDAFIYCLFDYIEVDQNNKNFKSIDGNLYSKDGRTFIQYAAGKEDIDFVLPGSVTAIVGNTFAGSENLISITIPSSVTKITGTLSYNSKEFVIYCEAKAPQEEWDYQWNFGNYPVVWNCKNNDKDENGYAYTIIDGIRYSVKDNTAKVIGQPITVSGDISIPDTVVYKNSTYNVKAIDGYAFNNNSKITSVTIGNNVKTIGRNAFENCTQITSLVIGNGVTEIAGYAFSNNVSLESVWLGNSIKNINDGAFDECTALKGVYISDLSAYCKIEFGWNASPLYYAHNLYLNNQLITDLVIPDDVTSINSKAFSPCELVSVTIPNSVEKIEGYSFGIYSRPVYYCEVTQRPDGWERNWNNYKSSVVWDYKNNNKDEDGYEYAKIDGISYKLKGNQATVVSQLKSLSGNIVIPSSVNHNGAEYTVVKIDDVAFADCSLITGIELPDSLTTIEQGAFSGCSSLSEIVLPNKIISISMHVFNGCTSLKKVVLSDNTVRISYGAFADCVALENINIPESIDRIENGAFTNCGKLKYNEYGNALYLGNENNPYVVFMKIKDSAQKSCIVNINTKAIVYNALSDSGLEEITIHASLLFYLEESDVKKIIISGGDSIDGMILSRCKFLETVVIPDSITSIRSDSFEYCSSISDFIVSENNQNYKSVDGSLYTKDGTELIRYATGKKNTEFIIPQSVTEIGAYAFKYCNNLESVVIGDSVKTIGFHAFMECTALKNIVIGAGVKTIEENAFNSCIALENISVSANNEHFKSIDGSLYTKDGTALIMYTRGKTDELFKLPDGVVTIGRDAFSGGQYIKYIIVPESLQIIDDSAFFFDINYEEDYELVKLLFVGQESDWSVKIGYSNLLSVCYYSETKPESQGEFWHYSDDGVTPVFWD